MVYVNLLATLDLLQRRSTAQKSVAISALFVATDSGGISQNGLVQFRVFLHLVYLTVLPHNQAGSFQRARGGAPYGCVATRHSGKVGKMPLKKNMATLGCCSAQKILTTKMQVKVKQTASQSNSCVSISVFAK